MSNSAPSAPTRDDDRPSGLALVAMLAALVIGFALLPHLFSPAASPLSGKDAPDVAIDYVANAPPDGASSVAALKGHPVLIDFWATWCGPCQATAPVVDAIARKYRDQGLAVIGMNTSDDAGNAAPWARAHHLTYAIAYDAGQRAAAAYGVQNLPTLVVISKTGKIVAVHTGMTSDAELDALVKKAL